MDHTRYAGCLQPGEEIVERNRAGGMNEVHGVLWMLPLVAVPITYAPGRTRTRDQAVMSGPL